MSGIIKNNGFTNETLDWKAWLDVVDPSVATPEQNRVLEMSHPKAKVSDYYRLLVHQRDRQLGQRVDPQLLQHVATEVGQLLLGDRGGHLPGLVEHLDAHASSRSSASAAGASATGSSVVPVTTAAAASPASRRRRFGALRGAPPRRAS